MTDDEKAIEISRILSVWAPLDKERAAAIGLSDYTVEAEDILWQMKLHGCSLRRAVSDVLEQAFLIELNKADLDHYVGEIEAVLARR